MKFNIEIKETQKLLLKGLQKKNIFVNGDDVDCLVIGLWAFILNNNKPFKNTIIITNNWQQHCVNYDDFSGEIEELSINHAGYVDQTNKEGFIKNEVLSFYLSNTLKREVSVKSKKVNERITLTSVDVHSWAEARFAPAIISILPKIFTELEVTQDKVTLLNEIRKANPTASRLDLLGYAANVDSIISSLVVENVEETLKKCMSFAKENEVAKLEKEIAKAKETLKVLLKDYQETLARCDNLCEELAYKSSHLEETEEDRQKRGILNELLLENPALQNIEIEDNYMRYNVLTYLEYYDSEIFKTVTSGDTPDRIYVLSNVRDDEKEDALRLLKTIFGEKKYKIRVYGGFSMCFHDENSRRKGIKNEVASEPIKEIIGNTWLPSPHGQWFSCVGSFAQQWIDAMHSGDLYMAIQYTIAYTQNINWGDATVCRALIENLMGKYKCHKILEDAAGNLWTPQEVIERVKTEDGQ